ncbi:NnrU family protein [Natronospira bacteriovora]|uniref:NnrU family protein n=1 Tax=Natronospira bacteriovora TaxID=3069753 RepID=A0ABU0W8B3_9GAMM|nr:NnrU family protein [Natronospira sp. AB-CW4]MDQ2070272.1 NnrU family protein [Natronospira sp. AB-CW4]
MILLIAGLFLIVLIHLLPAMPAIRSALVERLGEKTYLLLFSLVSVLAVVLLAAGMGRAEYIPLWGELPYGRDLSPLLMAAAVLLVTAAYVPNNLRRLIRNPMLWGVVLWAVAHLLVAGHLAALLLFGGIGGYALYAIFFRGGRRHWQSAEPRPWPLDLLTVVLAAIIYGALLWLHPRLFGPAII